MKIVYYSWVGREEQFVSNVDFDQTFVFLVLIMFFSIALSVWFSSPKKKKKKKKCDFFYIFFFLFLYYFFFFL